MPALLRILLLLTLKMIGGKISKPDRLTLIEGVS